MSLPFYKLVGTGNDFVFLNRHDIPDSTSLSDLAQELCNRHNGIGADGLVVIKSLQQKGEFAWDFFNSDGSEAEMCGNAARCTLLYCHQVLKAESVRFKSLIGWIDGVVEKDRVCVSWQLADPSLKKLELTDVNGQPVQGFFVDTGVPHFVIVDQDLDDNQCLLVQQHDQFQPRQTNVTLLKNSSQQYKETKTFERGVRGFTLACGTGVIASALALQSMQNADTYYLKAPGGPLEVRFEGTQVFLSGPAEIVFNGHYHWKGDPHA